MFDFWDKNWLKKLKNWKKKKPRNWVSLNKTETDNFLAKIHFQNKLCYILGIFKEITVDFFSRYLAWVISNLDTGLFKRSPVSIISIWHMYIVIWWQDSYTKHFHYTVSCILSLNCVLSYKKWEFLLNICKLNSYYKIIISHVKSQEI